MPEPRRVQGCVVTQVGERMDAKFGVGLGRPCFLAAFYELCVLLTLHLPPPAAGCSVRRQGEVVGERVNTVPCYFLRLLQLCSLCSFSPNNGTLNQDTTVFSARLISGWSVKQQGTGSHVESGSHYPMIGTEIKGTQICNHRIQ